MIKKMSVILLVLLFSYGRELKADGAHDFYSVFKECLEEQVAGSPYAAGMAHCLDQSPDHHFSSGAFTYFLSGMWFFMTAWVVVPISIILSGIALLVCLCSTCDALDGCLKWKEGRNR